MLLGIVFFFFFFKQKTAYEIKECDWSSDVCSSDLPKTVRDWGEARGKKINQRKLDRFSRMMRKPFGEGRIGTIATGEDSLDKTAMREEKANMIKNNLSYNQQRALVQANGDHRALANTKNKLSKTQTRFLASYNSRGEIGRASCRERV